uniref:TonB_dep_Rec domain-containing protein n=1 Tax=Steinernema glaseri TaxID=37863 RepID=A0A1I7YE56_9BILA
MSPTLVCALTVILVSLQEVCSQLRDRPRGLGLIKLPTGMTDERSSMFVPSLYIAGDKSSVLPQTVPDIHLPGQKMVFSGRPAFNPFTQAVSAMYHEDLTDSWGAGFAVSGVNNYALNVRRNFDDFADLDIGRQSGWYQPFTTAMVVGGEYDLRKIRDVAGHVDLPLPGINELFDFDGRITTKSFGGGVLTSNLDFPLSLADPHERFPASFNYLNFMADRFAHYGHVLPNVNLFKINRKKVMERLMGNKLNPTMMG